jgi:hypothetical protein
MLPIKQLPLTLRLMDPIQITLSAVVTLLPAPSPKGRVVEVGSVLERVSTDGRVVEVGCNAIGYANFYSRSHDAVIRVYDAAGNVIECIALTAYCQSRP